jgi:inorganic pyrophosphatase
MADLAEVFSMVVQRGVSIEVKPNGVLEVADATGAIIANGRLNIVGPFVEGLPITVEPVDAGELFATAVARGVSIEVRPDGVLNAKDADGVLIASGRPKHVKPIVEGLPITATPVDVAELAASAKKKGVSIALQPDGRLSVSDAQGKVIAAGHGSKAKDDVDALADKA